MIATVNSGLKAASPEVAAPARSHPAAAPALRRVSAMCTTFVNAAAVPLMRHFAAGTARRWAVPEERIDAVSLVVTELVTNAVLHSGSPEVSLLVTLDGTDLTVEVKDAGRWHDHQTPHEAADAVCGRGLDLVQHLTTWWLAFLSAAGTRVVARLSDAEA